jgi:glycosyltransferase involved in cell wall biosynthesis
MTKLPKISIITPSYNQGRYIGQTVQSVLSQGYPDMEYIVIDGGSTDGTIPILEANEQHLQWISAVDNGQSDAINKGLRMASGEVMGFLNSDDLYAPGALLAVGEYFLINPEAQWVTGRCRIINAEGREIRKLITLYKLFWLRVNWQPVLQVLNYISQPATFWRRAAMECTGYLDEDLHYAMEYDYWLRLSRNYPLRIIWKHLACFRIHPESKAGSSVNAQFDSELAIARRHVASHSLIALHRLHRALAIGGYRRIFFGGQLRSNGNSGRKEAEFGRDGNDSRNT